MIAIRHFFSIFLAVAVLSAAFPVFPPGDAGRNDVVGLEDTILLARNFMDTAQHPERFTNDLRSLITSFRTAAGLDIVIKTSAPVSQSSIRQLTDGLYIPSMFNYQVNLILKSFDLHYFPGIPVHAVAPDTPPPRFA